MSLSSWRAWIEIKKGKFFSFTVRSLSSWRAWIEIVRRWHRSESQWSLSSWRAWIEITRILPSMETACRSPHGERGLKSRHQHGILAEHQSLSSWRAWIEIPSRAQCIAARSSRSPHGERGLKYCGERSARSPVVALLMESVD